MDVFVMIRRKKTTIFTDAKENSTIFDMKMVIQGILKIDPINQQLSNEDGSVIYNDEKMLADYNFNTSNGRAHSPACIGLSIRSEDGKFEELEIEPLSSPPELPEVMKSQEQSSQQQAQVEIA